MFLLVYMVTLFDLVLLHGLAVCDFAIDDQAISVMFRVSTSFNITRCTKAVCWSRTITQSTCTQFPAVFKEMSVFFVMIGVVWIIIIISVLSLLIF